MKNLKRALSLVLSAAMMVGMMAMGTGAAVLKDVDSNDHDVAIGVIRVLGVMEGDENGNFNPDKTVTRNEMAVVMSNLAGLKLNGSHPFSDVPTWADKYVGALYVNGLTSGVSATTYGGTTNVTTTTAALMIMKTLGYFEYQGEFGEDWEYATVKRASQLDLFEDIDAGVKDELTRGELAQMILNALQKNTVTVYEESGMTVSGNGITVSEKAKYDYVEGGSLYAKLFNGSFDANIDYDAYGREGIEYQYTPTGKDTVYATIFEAADKTLVATKTIDLADLLDDAKLKYDNVATFDQELKAGYVVELFVNENDTKVLDNVVVYYYVADEIDEVEAADEDIDKNAIADGAKYIVTVDGVDFYDIELDGFDAKTFVKGAYILSAYSVNKGEIAHNAAVEFGTDDRTYNVVVDTTIAKKVTGKATTEKAGEFATIDDVKYVYAGEAGIDLTPGTSYNVYVDANGYVVAADEVKTTAVIDDVYYVVNVWNKTTDKDTYAGSNTTYYAQLVDMNGVASVITLEKYEKNTTTEYASANWNGKLVTISDKKWTNVIDGATKTYKAGNEKFDLAVWAGEDWNVTFVDNAETTLKKDATRVEVAGYTYRLNADTKYILIGDDDADIKTEVKTGGIAVYELAADVYVICPEKAENTVSYMIFAAAAEIEETAQYSKDVIFVKGASTELGDGFFNQTVYMADGSKQTMKIAAGEENERGFFTYNLNKDGYYELEAADAIASGSYIWDDEEGVIVDATITNDEALYNGLLTVGSIEDIKVADAKFVDAHSTTAGYDKTVSSLTKVMNLLEKGAISSVTLSMNVSKDGAVVIIVTEMA